MNYQNQTFEGELLALPEDKGWVEQVRVGICLLMLVAIVVIAVRTLNAAGDARVGDEVLEYIKGGFQVLLVGIAGLALYIGTRGID